MIDALAEGIGNVVEELASVGEDIIESNKQGISDAWDGLARWVNGIWDSLFGNRDVDVNVNKTTSGVDGSHANGPDYVPYKNYVANFH